MSRKLSAPQQELLDRVNASPTGWVFTSGARYRTAKSLEKRGLIETGSRRIEDGKPVVAYTGTNWCWTAERKS